MCEREEKPVVGRSAEFQRLPHREVETIADKDKRDVVERVRIAFSDGGFSVSFAESSTPRLALVNASRSGRVKRTI